MMMIHLVDEDITLLAVTLLENVQCHYFTSISDFYFLFFSIITAIIVILNFIP
jgi:hypothetical protein